MPASLRKASPAISHHCKKCNQLLSSDEIAITKKLINRGTTIYYCADCLAEAFDIQRSDIEAKIQYYKNLGCTLFIL